MMPEEDVHMEPIDEVKVAACGTTTSMVRMGDVCIAEKSMNACPATGSLRYYARCTTLRKVVLYRCLHVGRLIIHRVWRV
jgi:hypothetical protein